MDGHAVQGGGVIVDSGSFDWSRGDFPELTEPDESYHGIVYTKAYGNAAYIIKGRSLLSEKISFKDKPQGTEPLMTVDAGLF